MTQQKIGQTQVELTDNPEDKHPFRKKQQKAKGDQPFKEKDVAKKLSEARIAALKLKHSINRGKTK